MIALSTGQIIYLACGATDLRKAINGLSIIVQQNFKLDPFSHALFVFCNKNRDLIKILEWENSGFWLHTKRLEKGKFTSWPRTHGEVVQITYRQLGWLLEGLPIKQPHAHPDVLERSLI